jgi:predicted flap endonuclease-1-like 5' DNA nuclease
MNELLTQYWALIVVALLIGIAVAWFIFAANRKTRVEISSKSDEASEPARRNQALIDAPLAARPPASAAVLSSGDEDPKPTAPPTPAPAPAQPLEQTARDSALQADDLTRLKGVGPKLSTLLHSLGVNRFDQIANWADADIDRIDALLGNFQGRIRRDNWVEQAQFLAKGDTEGFQSRFGAL